MGTRARRRDESRGVPASSLREREDQDGQERERPRWVASRRASRKARPPRAAFEPALRRGIGVDGGERERRALPRRAAPPSRATWCRRCGSGAPRRRPRAPRRVARTSSRPVTAWRGRTSRRPRGAPRGAGRPAAARRRGSRARARAGSPGGKMTPSARRLRACRRAAGSGRGPTRVGSSSGQVDVALGERARLEPVARRVDDARPAAQVVMHVSRRERAAASDARSARARRLGARNSARETAAPCQRRRARRRAPPRTATSGRRPERASQVAITGLLDGPHVVVDPVARLRRDRDADFAALACGTRRLTSRHPSACAEFERADDLAVDGDTVPSTSCSGAVRATRRTFVPSGERSVERLGPPARDAPAGVEHLACPPAASARTLASTKPALGWGNS